MKPNLINPGPWKEGQGLMLALKKKFFFSLVISNFDVTDLNIPNLVYYQIRWMISLTFFFLAIHNLHIFWDTVLRVPRTQTLEYERSQAQL